MVYINTANGVFPSVYFPLNGYAGGLDALAVRLVNTADKKEVALDIVTALRRGWLAYLVLGGIPEGLTPGEWRYELAAGEAVIATGLLCAYDGERESTPQYNTQSKVKQYGE
jgi:hypothetical protein